MLHRIIKTSWNAKIKIILYSVLHIYLLSNVNSFLSFSQKQLEWNQFEENNQVKVALQLYDAYSISWILLVIYGW